MNLPQMEGQAPADRDLAAQYKSLRRLVHAIAVSLLILTGTVFVFVYRQVVLVRRQTAELARYLHDVEHSGMQTFVEQVHVKLNDFRMQHPDFTPIYARYWRTNEPALSEKVISAPASTTPSGAPPK
jgi:hypothetical protein